MQSSRAAELARSHPFVAKRNASSHEGLVPLIDLQAKTAAVDRRGGFYGADDLLQAPGTPAGAQGRVTYASFGVAPLEPEPDWVQRWQGRSRKQKWCLAAGVVGACAAIALGVGIGVGVWAQKRRTATEGNFVASFAMPEDFARWNVSDNRANGAAYRCGFTRQAARIQSDGLQLSIVDGPVADKPAGCGQLLRDGLFGYGLFAGQIQPLAAPGVVTALFLYAETSDGINQEIDIEFVGKNTSQLFATAYRDAKEITQQIDLGFDASASLHEYGFDWQPSAIRWLVDGREVYRLDHNLPRYTRQSLYISTWLREPSDWAGQYNASAPLPSGSSRFARVSYAR